MPKRPSSSVTSSELALLQILWNSPRPLNKQEILEKAMEDEENPLFAKNSFHILINELIAKEYLVPVDNLGMGRKNARRYAPTVSRNEFLALQVHTTQDYQATDIPEILAALMELSPDAGTEPVLVGIEKLIKKKREENKGSDEE
ncbi:hypothetical protein D5272_14650 [bacterium D16-76]|nr:hypothetical protein [bacterium D16-76]